MIIKDAFRDEYLSGVADGSPRVQALTLDYAKQHIRALGTADDALTMVRIDAAVSYFEEQTGRQLLTANRRASLDYFPFIGSTGIDARIELPRPPLKSVSSVQYLNNGVWTSFVSSGSPATPQYTVIPSGLGEYCRRGVVEPFAAWPTIVAKSGAVRINYTCGYGDSMAAIPPLVRGILCFLVAHFDTFIAPVVTGTIVNELPFGIRDLMNAFKYSAYPTQALRDYASDQW